MPAINVCNIFGSLKAVPGNDLDIEIPPANTFFHTARYYVGLFSNGFEINFVLQAINLCVIY